MKLRRTKYGANFWATLYIVSCMRFMHMRHAVKTYFTRIISTFDVPWYVLHRTRCHNSNSFVC